MKSKFFISFSNKTNINYEDGKTLDSKMVMYPSGHARNTAANLKNILNYKFNLLGRLALSPQDLNKYLEIIYYLILSNFLFTLIDC